MNFVNLRKSTVFAFILLFALTAAFADKARFYQNGKVIDTMYVDSAEGLRVRDKPSLKSNRLCALQHRLPVKVVAIGKEEKIDFSAIKSDQFVMTMTVSYDGVQQYAHKTEGHTGKENDNDHFWCLAIKSDKLGKGLQKGLNREKMKIEGTIEKIYDPKLISVMKKALETNKKIKVECEEGSSIIKVKFGGEYEGN